MRFCTKCGHQVHETAPACPACGAPRLAQQATNVAVQTAHTRSVATKAAPTKTPKVSTNTRRNRLVEGLAGVWALAGVVLLVVSAYQHLQTGVWPEHSIADWLGITPADSGSLILRNMSAGTSSFRRFFLFTTRWTSYLFRWELTIC